MSINAGVMLAPNQHVDPEELSYPRIASFKLDGVRGLFYGDRIVSRTGKPLSNAIHQMLKEFRESVGPDWVFDGEVFAYGHKFNQIMSMIKPSAVAVPLALQYHVFDGMSKSAWDAGISLPYEDRIREIGNLVRSVNHRRVKFIDTMVVRTSECVAAYYEEAIASECEGLILRHPNSRYKHGRATLKEDSIHKLKPWTSIDCRIVDFVQAEVMSAEYAEGPRTTNALGYLERTTAKDTRVLVEKIGSFVLLSPDGVRCGAGIARGSELRDLITWQNKEQFRGRMVECRYLDHGIKDKLRFLGMVRLRPDLDT